MPVSQSLLLECTEEIRGSTTGTLSLYSRFKVWEWMNQTFESSAHRRRVLLNCIVVGRVALPAWQSEFLTEPNIPLKYLGLCRDFLLEKVRQDAVLSILRNETEDIAGYGAYDSSDGAARRKAMCGTGASAAEAAAWVCVWDEPCFRLGRRKPTPADVVEEDSFDFDAHFLCSCVAADGGEWDNHSSVHSRREFWSMWLNDALPLACGDVIDSMTAGDWWRETANQ